MKLISIKDVMPIGFLELENYTGSSEGMRYRMEKFKKEEKDVLKITVWPEPYCYLKTKEENKNSAFFSFDEEGLKEGVGWLNEEKERYI